MNSETFVKICGLLNLTAEEVAKQSGYSLSAVKAARTGARGVSAELEKFLLNRLKEASDDEAVQLVMKTCKQPE